MLLHSVREFGIIGWQPRNALAHLALTANAAPAHDHGWPGGLPSPAHPRLFCRRPNGTAFIPIALTVEMTVPDCIMVGDPHIHQRDLALFVTQPLAIGQRCADA